MGRCGWVSGRVGQACRGAVSCRTVPLCRRAAGAVLIITWLYCHGLSVCNAFLSLSLVHTYLREFAEASNDVKGGGGKEGKGRKKERKNCRLLSGYLFICQSLVGQ